MKKRFFLLAGIIPALGVSFAAKQSVPNAALFKDNHLDKFISDIAYTDSNAYKAHAQELNKEIAEQGMTLLKNDGTLPFANVKKISVFGKASTNPQLGGGGSGSGSVSSGITKYDLQKSLEEAGFELNPTLTAFYKDNNKSGSGRNTPTKWDGTGYNTVGETPIEKYTSDITGSFGDYNDAAVVLLARAGTEGADCRAANAKDADNDPAGPSGKHYLQLSKNEEAMFDLIKQNFDKIVVLINSGNAFQCDQFENDDAISAVIWTGTPGANGFVAVGEILNGTVNPSGHTVDTWERDFRENPTFENFADNAQTNDAADSSGTPYPQDTMFNADGTPVNSAAKATYVDEEHKVVAGGLNGVRPSAYVSYEEGVYMDYRYYETVYADLEAEQPGSGDDWYASEKGVIYPFGFGLSYTEFSQEIVSCNVKDQKVKEANTKVTLSVKVTNKGSVAGRDAVQVYFKAPYTAGGIEKPYEVLCAFAKTDLLQPGANQVVDLEFYLQDVASYDFSDANKNGFVGYELDGGEYQISVNKNAHEVYDSCGFKIQKQGLWYQYDRYTGTEVKNRFTDRGFYSSLPGENDIEFTQFTRADKDGTFPQHPSLEDRTLKANSRVEEFYTHAFVLDDIDLTDDYEYMPEAAKRTKEFFQEKGWTQQPDGSTLSADASTPFKDMIGVPLDDPKWDDVLNEFTWTEMMQFVTGGGQHNPSMSRNGKQATGDRDGPSKAGAMWWCGAPIVAATFNIDLANEQGACVGIEAHIDGTYGWAGPGVNLHRSPFGGRNFEYYSADPFLTGRMAGRVVAGAQDKGVYCYFKHFAVNDQEKGREGVSAFLTEQALRELYLKPFQMVVQEGKASGIMSSYNRIGLMETAASYPLLTEVLREEWGFVGSIISDMTHNSNSSFDHKLYENVNNRILAGCNQQLDSNSYRNAILAKWDNNAFDGKGAPTFTGLDGQTYESYSFWYAVREMVKGCLWMNANCGVYERTFVQSAEGVEFSGLVDNFYKCAVGDDVDININVPTSFNGKSVSSVTLELDPVTPLPDGLSLDGTKISGKAADSYNGFIHVMFNVTYGDGTSEVLGASFELYVAKVVAQPVPAGEDDPDEPVTPPKKKGCGGAIEATAAIIGLITLAGAGIMLVSKKRKQEN